LELARWIGDDTFKLALAACQFHAKREEDDIDPAIALLRDIRLAFKERRMYLPNHCFSSADLLEAVRSVEDPQYPGELTKADLSAILRRFKIRPKRHHDPVTKKKIFGYRRADFEAHWREHLDRS
jgi:hypothetical protein